ncbi:MAG: exodeoxyribonuclease V subunit beta [Rhodobacteraceae bacterium]|nr:exodeoxyribonuclease V subunit beta [Paracoccaceae bacterium]
MSEQRSDQRLATRELDVFACPLDRRCLIEASAGTGKTWNICGLYLRLLLEQGLETQQILVVTFTNAATAELRQRLRARIVDVLAWLRNETTASDAFVARLVAAVEANASVDRQRLRTLLEAALHTFDEAAVFTIHGFCQRALSDTPFAAGLPFSLELVQDDQALRLEAVSDFWRRQVAGDQISPALADYLAERQDSPEKWARLLKRQMAKSLSRVLWPPETEPQDSACEATAVDLPGLRAAFEKARRLWAGAGAAPTAALLAGLPALHAGSYKEDGVRTAAASWTHWLASGAPLAAPDPESGKTRLFATDFIAGKTRKNQTPPSDPFFDAAADLLAAQRSAARALQLARLRLLRRMLTEAAAAMRQAKRRQRVLSFDDMLYNVHLALTAGDHPWLAASLRARYPVALIDEFQDTDPLQYAIFDAVYGAAGGRPAAPLFLVGDPKQAIYSFRNADLHTYLTARRETGAQGGLPYTLRHNQRSSGELIAACNALFVANPDAFILAGLDYQPVSAGEKPRQAFSDLSQPGDTATAALRVWRLPDSDGGYLPRAEAMPAALRATAGEVARLLAEALAGRVCIGERPLAPGDIAILVRSHRQGRLTRDALRQVGVGSVELSQHSIYQTPDAESLERVLLAIVEPARQSLLHAALASELMGFDAHAIAALAADEQRVLQTMSRFSGYRDVWLRRGFGVMLRSWIDDQAIASRLLARNDGERRLTNLLHLGELLQQASREHPSPEALLRWLASRRSNASGEGADEVAQLRLESDRNLVQIVTIHKAKGLEYPLVFCPFLWDGQRSGGDDLEGLEYHDRDGRPVIDFRPGNDDDPDELDGMKEIKRRRAAEQHAEFMRLLYVALTRAVHRCYLVAGCYSNLSFGRLSTTQSRRSLLNWLVAGKGIGYAGWLEHRLSEAEIEEAWRELARTAGSSLSLSDLPGQATTPLPLAEVAAERLSALPPPAIAAGWRIGSFSSLQHGAESEAAASDHDARERLPSPLERHSPAERRSATPSSRDLAADDILRFPRGPAAGDCVHALFERIDFGDPGGWPAAIEEALLAHPQTLPGLPPAESASRLARMLRRMLDDVLATPLPGGIVLATIPRRQRLVELAFHLPAAELRPQRLNAWLHEHGYPLPRLGFAPLSGYLRGFIDLIFRHGERFYVLDWKSNHLGDGPADYAPAQLARAMAEHGYHLQYLLYGVALHRHLGQRLAGYDFERHFGGVHYLFVRGVRPAWLAAAIDQPPQACGVYHHRPARATIDSLDALLAGRSSATVVLPGR